MMIAIGTTNESKVDAFKDIAYSYPIFLKAKIKAVSVDSGVSDQPVSLDETIQGAMNRARKAKEKIDADYGVGLESGIFKVSKTKSGYMDTTCCAIYDGEKFHLGLSSCFEYPPAMIEMVIKEKINISQAAKKMNLSKDENIGSREGMIGILTKGRINRKEYTKQAIVTAMIHLENENFYTVEK